MQLQLLLVVGALGAASCMYNDKIVNGDDADAAKYPWLISLYYDGYRLRENELFCQGALVSPSFILTAAHCFYPNDVTGDYDPSKTTVVAGLQNLNEEGQQSRTAVEVFFHPNYNNDTWEYDFAIFKVDTPFEINESVNVTVLTDRDRDVDMKRCYNAGFGWIKEGTQKDPKTLQEYKATVRSRSKCRAAADKENNPDAIFGTSDAIKGHMMCTKNKKQGSCWFDEGGPLTCWDKETGEAITVAIHSWTVAEMPCKRGWNVWMRVQFAYDWIVETTTRTPTPTPTPGQKQ